MRHYRLMFIFAVLLLAMMPVVSPVAAQQAAPVTVDIGTNDSPAVVGESSVTVTIALNGSTADCPIIQTNRPVDSVLLIDTSGSMQGGFLDAAKEAGEVFVRTMNTGGGDQIGLVEFGSRSRQVRPLSSDANALIQDIQGLSSGGGTNIAAGIGTAFDTLTDSTLRNPEASRVIVLLSDGESNANDAIRAANQAKAAGARIVTIGLGSGINENLLRDLADTPQDFYPVQDASQLAATYRQVAQTIRPTTAARELQFNYTINRQYFELDTDSIRRGGTELDPGTTVGWTLGELGGRETEEYSLQVRPVAVVPAGVEVGTLSGTYLQCEQGGEQTLTASGPSVQIVPPTPTPTPTPTFTPTPTNTPTPSPTPTAIAPVSDGITPATNVPTSLTQGLNMCVDWVSRWLPIILGIIALIAALLWTLWNWQRLRNGDLSTFWCFLTRSLTGSYAAFAFWLLLLPPVSGLCPTQEGIYFFRQSGLNEDAGLGGVYLSALEADESYPYRELNADSCVGCHTISGEGQLVAAVRGIPPAPLSLREFNGTEITPPTLEGVEAVYSDFSPDGTKLVIADGNGDLQIYDIEQDTLQKLNGASEQYVIETMPSWGPNGEIAFVRTMDINQSYYGGLVIETETDIYTVSETGGTAEPVNGASGGGFNYYPSYSPDGNTLAFTRHNNRTTYQDEQAEIFVVPAGGGAATRLALNDDSTGNSWSSWSQDGQYLTYSGNGASASPDIYYAEMDANANSGAVNTVVGAANTSAIEVHPVFAPVASRVDWVSQLLAMLFPWLFPLLPLGMLSWSSCAFVRSTEIEDEPEDVPPQTTKPAPPPGPLPLPDAPLLWEPQPTLVIGLGETGRWVLTHLKKTLLDSRMGEMPDRIGLMVVDTGAYTRLASEDAAIRFAGVELDEENEVIELTDNLKTLVDDPSFENDPQFRKWWQSSRVNTIGARRLDLQEGAKKQRLLGRAGFLYHLRAYEDNFFTRMKAAIPSCVDPDDQRLQVVVVGDTVGDVSSAVLFDVAFLVRGAAQQLGNVDGVSITAHIATDKALDDRSRVDYNRDRDLANTGAFLRELRRFQLAESRPFPIHYPEIDENVTEEMPLDDIVFYDGGRGQFDIAEPKVGVYPVMADGIAQFMDKSARRGQVGSFLKEQSTRLSDAQKKNYEVHVASQSIFSYRLPFADLLNMIRYRLEEEILLRLFVGQSDTLAFDMARDPRVNQEAQNVSLMKQATGFFDGTFNVMSSQNPVPDWALLALRVFTDERDSEYRAAMRDYETDFDLLAAFQARLKAALELILNGRADVAEENIFIARGGKMGYAFAFLEALTDVISRAVASIETREGFDEEREDLTQALEAFYEQVTAVKQSLAAQMAALGVDSEREITVRSLIEDERRATLHRDEMDAIVNRHYIWTESPDEDDDKTLDKVWYDRYMGEASQEVLKRFFWHVDESGTVTLRLHSGETPIELAATDDAVRDFKQALLDLATSKTSVIQEQRTFDKMLRDRLLTDHHNQVDNTAVEMSKMAQPMLSVDEWVANEAEYTNIVSAPDRRGDDDDFSNALDNLNTQLEYQQSQPISTYELASTDAHTLALIKRMSLVPLEGVTSLEDAEWQYRRNHGLSNNPDDKAPDRPILTSVYEAEAEALRLERQLVDRLRMRKDLLHPLVVTALTDSARTQVFCMALASGEIDFEELPGDEGYEVLYLTREGDEKVFEIHHLLKDDRMHIFIKSLLTFVLDRETFDDEFVARMLHRYTREADMFVNVWENWYKPDGAWNDWMDELDDADSLNSKAVFDILKLSRLYALIYTPRQ